MFVICLRYPMEEWLVWFNRIYIEHTKKLTLKWFSKWLVLKKNSNVVIRTTDTDVLIIVLAKYHHTLTYGLKLGYIQKTLYDTLMWTSCIEKLVTQFVNLFQLTMLLQVATKPILFLRRGKSAPLNTSKRMKLYKKYLVAWVSMRKWVEKFLVQLNITFVPYMEN